VQRDGQRRGTFRALRHRNYRLFFLGQMVSVVGSWVQLTALMWLAFHLTGTSRWPALVAAAQLIPGFLLGAWGGALADRRDERGYVRVDDQLRVAGETNVFAVGGVSDADRDMAGIASRQAALVAANIRTLITGEGELQSWETMPWMIAIPLGPEGGAGLLGDGVADAATISGLKGRDMGMGHFQTLFNAGVAA